MHPAMNQLSQLPVSERLELVQDLWDSIGDAREQLPIQEWHRELVKARLAEFDGREEELGLSRDQVWEQVDGQRGS
jgi:putative addiction module component (TIGR02574 family)